MLASISNRSRRHYSHGLHGRAAGSPERKEILYNVPTICHATAPISDPAHVTKNPVNPVFSGSGQGWDRYGVREAEILKGPGYFDIFYGGYDGTEWTIGHVRTRDFIKFEPNPHNPIFRPSSNTAGLGQQRFIDPTGLCHEQHILHDLCRTQGHGLEPRIRSAVGISRI